MKHLISVGVLALVLFGGSLFYARVGRADPPTPPPTVCDFLGTLGHCPTATNTPIPTDTPVPTVTSTPTDTATPTDTSTPTGTPFPTATNTPTATPTPERDTTYVISGAITQFNGDVISPSCDSGDALTGGGFSSAGGSSTFSRSFPEGDHWRVRGPGDATVYAICLDNSPNH